MSKHVLQRLFMLDVIRDPNSRPVFLWGLTTLLIGTLVYHYLEGWSYLDSIYFCVISLATIGYGDFTPKTPIGKVFTIFYVLNGIVILLSLFDQIRSVRKQHYEERKQQVEERKRVREEEAKT